MPPDPNYPRMMFHRMFDPVIVQSAQEEQALGQDWARTIWPAEPEPEPEEPEPEPERPESPARQPHISAPLKLPTKRKRLKEQGSCGAL